MNKYMKEALKEAKKAAEMGEIPVGAVIVKDGEIIARGHNLTETSKDPTAHAEMIAIREAAKFLGGWRLIGCDMYVSMEPCSMCAGALVWSRIRRLYIGADDEKSGACGSVFNIVEDNRLNHRLVVERGIMAEESSQLVREFFRSIRKKKTNKPEGK
ncbi:MAG: tRNA adenosine(34) deaminase TadA [Eubacterium sp.]|nr:tRNA adenosine(34) deaminase TadA [Eubacterium sp.]